MVNEYVKLYGGPKSGINADVAEAYSVGQIVAQAVTATGGTDNAKIIAYLHSGVTLSSVQGEVTFDALGENGAAGGVRLPVAERQLRPGPATGSGSSQIDLTKPPWTGAVTTSPPG